MNNLSTMTFSPQKSNSNKLGWMRFDSPLENRGNISFHWTDCSLAIERIQDQSRSDQACRHFFKKEFAEILRLKEMYFWEKTEDKIVRHNFWDLYTSLIRNNNAFTENLLTQRKKISLLAPRGPFMDLALFEVLSQEMYLKMNIFSLWQKLIEPREFRVRTKSSILVESGVDFSNSYLVELLQISLDGILIKADSSRVLNQNNFRIHINPDHFSKIKNDPLVMLSSSLDALYPFYTLQKSQSFVINQNDIQWSKSLDYFKSGTTYGFIKFEQIQKSNELISRNLKDSIQETFFKVKILLS